MRFRERTRPERENGYNESFDSKLRDELINREIFYTLWEAKVLAKYRGTCDRAPICGIAPTLAGAKKIVETLCYETETCERKPKIVKNDLFEMILFFVQKCQDTKDKSHAHINDIQNIFGDKGIAKLVEMIDAKIILRCSNGMLLFSSK